MPLQEQGRKLRLRVNNKQHPLILWVQVTDDNAQGMTQQTRWHVASPQHQVLVICRPTCMS
jgi:hypothetical protein